MTRGTTEREELLQTLKSRFESNALRNAGTTWAVVRARLKDEPDAVRCGRRGKWKSWAASRT